MWVRPGLSDEFWSDSMADPMTQGHYIVYSKLIAKKSELKVPNLPPTLYQNWPLRVSKWARQSSINRTYLIFKKQTDLYHFFIFYLYFQRLIIVNETFNDLLKLNI